MEKDNTYRKLEKDFAAIRDERGTQANTANRIGSAFLSLLSYIGSAAFLRKDVPDTAEQVMTFLKGIVAKAVSYFQGIVNRGDIKNYGDITNKGNIHNTGDITNTGSIMTNNLTVTGKATFFELEIQKAKAAGGMSVNSAGTFHIDAVEETADGFVCYQRAEKDGVMLLQTCEPKDQMMCSNGMNSLPLQPPPTPPKEGGSQRKGDQTNDGKPHAIGNHYYWRLATEAPKEVVTHTIDGKEEKCLKLVLSKTDRHKLKNESPQDIGDIPKVGDDLVQIGNRDNKERQSVMMSCAYNSFDPDLKPSYWAHYMGVNDYEISKHRYTWFAANGSNVTGNFKVQSDDGGLESIEDYVKGLATEKGKDTVVWQVAFSIRNITGKQGETFKIKYGRTEGESTSWYDDNPTYHDFNQLYAVIIDGATGNERMVSWETDLNVADFFTGGSMTVQLKDSNNEVILAQDTIYPEAKQGKDAVSYKLLPISEIALAYISENKETKVKTNKVDLKLEYKIQKTVGDNVSFTTLGIEGMTLTIQPSVEEDFSYESYSVSHVLEKREMTYVEIPDNSYVVTLEKGSDIVDQRIVPVTFKPKVVFDIDTVNGSLTSEIKTVKGQMSKIEQTAEHISLTVDGGIRPNLLWGSDLNLDGVDTTNKAAIQKHLGVGLNAVKVDSTEWFEYLKGGGVGGADAVKAKVTAVNGEGNYFAGLYWQNAYGAKSNIKVKPNTKYTFSFWIRTEILQGSGYAVAEGFNMESLTGGRKDRTMPWTDVKATNEWERKSYTFTTGDTGYIMVGVGLSGGKDFSGLIYLCHPKLEEGNTATPWCAYDGTVEGLKRTGIDIESGEITLDADKTTVKGDLTAKSLQTEGDPAKGGGTVVANGGMITVYGVNKSVPGIEIGLNEAGEPVLKMYKNGKFMYDLGPDTIFEQVIERENAFTPCDMHRICNTAGNDMEKSFGGDFPNNYRKMVAYVFSEGYKRVGNQTRYKVSDTNEISTYNGVHFAEQRSVSGITANELESMSRIADGWYLNGGGPRVSDPSEPAYDGSNPQGYTCRRFGVRYYSNGKATSKLGSFTVCGNSQTGWTVEKIDIPFLNSQI